MTDLLDRAVADANARYETHATWLPGSLGVACGRRRRPHEPMHTIAVRRDEATQ